MKKIKLKIIDNIVQILEIAILAISIVIPYLVDFQNIFREYMMKEYPKPENFILLLALNKGNLAISVAFFVFVFLKIRKYNLNCIMCNKNIYHDYSYFWFCFCAKILGINNCNLVLVPIWLQFKLVINNIFQGYPLNEKEYPVIEDERETKILKRGKVHEAREINLILEDTYPISEFQIPQSKRGFPVIKLSRNDGKDLGRHFSEQFINAIITEVRMLENGVIVNVFATTNPMNTINIASRVFKNADHGNIDSLYVYKQKNIGGREFESKGKKIY